jgi:CheY-like chemotaxis protein
MEKIVDESNLPITEMNTSKPRLRVLLVEDNADALEGIIEMTDFLGHDAQGCQSAEEALLMLKQQAFDLMITDIGLPGMSGLELSHQARAIQPLEIVVASGYARGPDMPPDVGWLMKPFGIDEYAALLERAARQQNS